MSDAVYFDTLASKGIVFHGAKERLTADNKATVMDSAASLQTTANAGVPPIFTTYIDSDEVVEILTAKRNAREIMNEAKKGDITTTHAMFRVEELTGGTTPYDDFADGATSGNNENYPTREQYLFQTTIRWGVREQAMAGKAMFDLANSKRRAAARSIEIDSNKFALYGVAGKACYGLLNEPNLNSAVTPTTGASGNTWALKTPQEIMADVLALWKDMQAKSGSNVDMDSDIVLVADGAAMAELGKASIYNVSAKDMIDKFFGGKIKYIVLPELATATGHEVMLIARKVLGQDFAKIAFGVKYEELPVFQRSSSWEQKVFAGTFGTILYYPFAVATMVGL